MADWWNAGAGSHLVQFYSADDVLVELLARFVGTALVTGDAAIVLATRQHREAMSLRLRRRGLDVGTALEQGRFVAIDAASFLEKLVTRGAIDCGVFGRVLGQHVDRAARAAGGRRYRVTVFGGFAALAWASGRTDAALALEEQANMLARDRDFSLCCAYPMKCFASGRHAPAFLRICAQHSHVFPAEHQAQ